MSLSVMLYPNILAMIKSVVLVWDHIFSTCNDTTKKKKNNENFNPIQIDSFNKNDWHITDKKVLRCYNKSYNKERH